MKKETIVLALLFTIFLIPLVIGVTTTGTIPRRLFYFDSCDDLTSCDFFSSRNCSDQGSCSPWIPYINFTNYGNFSATLFIGDGLFEDVEITGNFSTTCVHCDDGDLYVHGNGVFVGNVTAPNIEVMETLIVHGNATCEGTALECSLFSTVATCGLVTWGGQRGCRWNWWTSSCVGTSTPCNEMSTADCNNQLSCIAVTGVGFIFNASGFSGNITFVDSINVLNTTTTHTLRADDWSNATDTHIHGCDNVTGADVCNLTTKYNLEDNLTLIRTSIDDNITNLENIYLNLSGTNADRHINVSPYNLELRNISIDEFAEIGTKTGWATYGSKLAIVSDVSRMMTGFDPNLADGDSAYIGIGKALSAKNSAWLRYYHATDGSTNNYVSLGLFSVDNIIDAYGDGNVKMLNGNLTTNWVFADVDCSRINGSNVCNVISSTNLANNLTSNNQTLINYIDGEDNNITNNFINNISANNNTLVIFINAGDNNNTNNMLNNITNLENIYLNLSGTNANQNVTLGLFNFTANKIVGTEFEDATSGLKTGETNWLYLRNIRPRSDSEYQLGQKDNWWVRAWIDNVTALYLFGDGHNITNINCTNVNGADVCNLTTKYNLEDNISANNDTLVIFINAGDNNNTNNMLNNITNLENIYLNLSGTNADRHINVSPYEFRAKNIVALHNISLGEQAFEEFADVYIKFGPDKINYMTYSGIGTTFNFSNGILIEKDQIGGGHTIQVVDLPDCDTIDTDANGVFGCGTDDDTGNTTEEIQDSAWDITGGTQTGITVTYQDGTDDVDFEVTLSDTNCTNTGECPLAAYLDNDYINPGGINFTGKGKALDWIATRYIEGQVFFYYPDHTYFINPGALAPSNSVMVHGDIVTDGGGIETVGNSVLGNAATDTHDIDGDVLIYGGLTIDNDDSISIAPDGDLYVNDGLVKIMDGDSYTCTYATADGELCVEGSIESSATNYFLGTTYLGQTTTYFDTNGNLIMGTTDEIRTDVIEQKSGAGIQFRDDGASSQQGLALVNTLSGNWNSTADVNWGLGGASKHFRVCSDGNIGTLDSGCSGTLLLDVYNDNGAVSLGTGVAGTTTSAIYGVGNGQSYGIYTDGSTMGARFADSGTNDAYVYIAYGEQSIKGYGRAMFGDNAGGSGGLSLDDDTSPPTPDSGDFEMPDGSMCVDDDGACTPNVNDGHIKALVFDLQGHSDIAEMYEVNDQSLNSTNVVCFDENGLMGYCNGSYDTKIAGVISTKPGFLANSVCDAEENVEVWENYTFINNTEIWNEKLNRTERVSFEYYEMVFQGYDYEYNEDGSIKACDTWRPIGMKGKIPVKVKCDDPIYPGDLLVSDETPGYGRKFNPEFITKKRAKATTKLFFRIKEAIQNGKNESQILNYIDNNQISYEEPQTQSVVFGKAIEECLSGEDVIEVWLI